MELRAELEGRTGGRRQEFIVPCEKSLKGMIAGVSQLKEQLTVALSELVAKEKVEESSQTRSQVSDDDGEDEDDSEEEGEMNDKITRNGPPAKRTKTQQS
ncbi:EKC/KEOPS complex subunit GON7 [Latimeria chalumnae]|uniref:EKC/KEOPS complex subunit GON7 n=1 Tax=Latimeria chalumnae TaxID=7897 RepID=UPI0003C189C4|nr:PREDICTED: uncharacterized protein C14orf142 homolog [Latimeria chalumnae]|eukprot:XP_005986671.1 PREDICTED: uncharacterized protein C14orf142 homolog [Latimeria chalumnae]